MTRFNEPDGTFGNGPLRRLRQGRVVMGVAGGIADWLGTGRLLVRLVFVALGIMFNFMAVIGYLVLAFLLDRERTRAERLDAGMPYESRGERRRRRRDGDERGGADSDDFEPSASPGSVVARFRDLERRLRQAEAEVTSPGFRIDRELKRTRNGQAGTGGA